jgi:hypothetical protein
VPIDACSSILAPLRPSTCWRRLRQLAVTAILCAGWLVGSIAAGVLYDRSILALVAFAGAAQLGSIPLFVSGSRASSRPPTT